MDGRILSKVIIGANRERTNLFGSSGVLWPPPNNGPLRDDVIGAHRCVLLDRHSRKELAIVANDDIVFDHRKRPHFNAIAELSATTD